MPRGLWPNTASQAKAKTDAHSSPVGRSVTMVELGLLVQVGLLVQMRPLVEVVRVLVQHRVPVPGAHPAGRQSGLSGRLAVHAQGDGRARHDGRLCDSPEHQSQLR